MCYKQYQGNVKNKTKLSKLFDLIIFIFSSGKRINLQHDLWNRINQSSESISELMPAIGLLVKDPRLVLPKKKLFTKTYQQTQKSTKTELDAGSLMICYLRSF